MPTESDDILTVQEVQEDALESSSAVEDNAQEVVERAIRDAQDRIVSYLHRPVIASVITESIGRYDWVRDEKPTGGAFADTRYLAWAKVQPVVEVDSPEDVEVFLDQSRLVHDRQEALKVTYIAGWKRRDQAKADLDVSPDQTPPNLPNDIRRVALKLALFELAEAQHGAGIGQVTQAVGNGQTTTVQGPDSGYVDRQLSRLDSYRNATL